MKRQQVLCMLVVATVLLILIDTGLAREEPVRPLQPVYPVYETMPPPAPFVIVQQGVVTWVNVHTSTAPCPGDPDGGHGGEATGGPDGSQTWCFEEARYMNWGGNDPVTESDTCGTNPPYTYLCFDHVDVRALTSQTDTNFWHVDDYRTDQHIFLGNYCMWCGSESLWTDMLPVECGTWHTPPGYGNQWNCVLELELPDTFDVAHGCTVYFDLRYDTEPSYDFLHFEIPCDCVWPCCVTSSIANYCGSSSDPDTFSLATLMAGAPERAGEHMMLAASVDWLERSHPDTPAVRLRIPPDSLCTSNGPRFRWRFESDAAVSDADGLQNTDGGVFIDNVWVLGDKREHYQEKYFEDFEVLVWDSLDARGWTRPAHEGLVDLWHQVHDADPPYEGGDGDAQTSCLVDSSVMWRARPEMGYPYGACWEDGWFYRLISPAVPIQNSGCVFQYDQYMCHEPYTCDYMDTKVRFRDARYDRWCPWINIDGYILSGGCGFWNLDFEENVSHFYGGYQDSVQFGWDIMDLSRRGDFCRGRHKGTDHIVDNVSVGFFDGDATVFRSRAIDLLHDTFNDSICGFNSSFPVYDRDSVTYYSGPGASPLPAGYQLLVDVTDNNLVQEVLLFGSVDYAQTWVNVPMALFRPADPLAEAFGWTYYGTLCPEDFGFTRWPRGTEVWYYVRCEDHWANIEYFPGLADPANPEHTGDLHDYFSFSILPLHPLDFEHPRILFVDGFGRWVSEWSPCLEDVGNRHSGLDSGLEEIYESTLAACGYCYDKFDINGAGCNVRINPVEFAGHYDCVIWTVGPYFSNYLIDGQAQAAICDFLKDGGKVVLCGDRLAYNMAPLGSTGLGCDELGGEFLAGVMGADCLGFMADPAEKPYVYLEAAPACAVFGSPVDLNPDCLDSLLLYRWCPGRLRDMDYVRANASPPAGYLAQPLLYVLNPDAGFEPSDAGIYIEVNNTGQCVFLDFDLSALINQNTRFCTGATPDGVPSFVPGNYDGRVELLSTILETIMGLVPPYPGGGNGGGGTADLGETDPVYRWALSRARPNPALGRTEIRFEVARSEHVSIRVYNAGGRLVRTLVDERKAPGQYSAQWNGTNQGGQRVSAGVYFCRMQAGDFRATGKVLFLD